jgi:hypothetical protein
MTAPREEGVVEINEAIARDLARTLRDERADPDLTFIPQKVGPHELAIGAVFFTDVRQARFFRSNTEGRPGSRSSPAILERPDAR